MRMTFKIQMRHSSDGDGIGDKSIIFDPNQECYCENDIDNDGICDDDRYLVVHENAENYNSSATVDSSR